jgi:hypothetical protein
MCLQIFVIVVIKRLLLSYPCIALRDWDRRVSSSPLAMHRVRRFRPPAQCAGCNLEEVDIRISKARRRT